VTTCCVLLAVSVSHHSHVHTGRTSTPAVGLFDHESNSVSAAAWKTYQPASVMCQRGAATE